MNNPMPSWNDGPTKQSILDFVARVTQKDGPDFVPEQERIATFDNDGTLWCERPLPFQVLFAFDRIRELASHHPEWKDQQPYKAVIESDMKALGALGTKGLMTVMAASHAGGTMEEFDTILKDWFATAKHPHFKRLYTEIVFQPMIELLTYLRDNGFKTFIVSGGGVEFMRSWVENTYGIPPEQVVGSSIVTQFEIREGKPVLVRLPQLFFLDDGAGKAIGINRFIGRRPIAAFGNSDGDLEMLQWTAAGPGARLCSVIHHTDAGREWAYDDTALEKMSAVLKEAKARGWTVVDMKNDWNRVFPFENVQSVPRSAQAA